MNSADAKIFLIWRFAKIALVASAMINCGGGGGGSDAPKDEGIPKVVDSGVVSSSPRKNSELISKIEPSAEVTEVNSDPVEVIDVDTESPEPPSLLSFDTYTHLSSTSPDISFQASSSSDVANYRMFLGSSIGAKDIVAGIDLGLTTSHTASSLTLSECAVIYPSVNATDDSGNTSDTLVAEEGFIYDITKPTAPSNLIVSTDAATYTGGKLVSWDAGTDNCATTHYEVSIGSAAGLNDIADWTVSESVNFQFTGLNLVEDTDYFTNVRAIDLADNRSDAMISSGAWRLPGVPAAVDDFGIASRGSFHIELAWTKPFDNGSPIIDYTVEMKKTTETDFVSFADGISNDTILMVTGLEADTSYDFRVKSYNGNISPYSATVSAQTLIDNTFFESTTYKAMNLGGATESKVVAFEDETEVTLNDTVIATLDAGETFGFVSAQNDILESDKPVFVAGRRGAANAAVGDQGNMVWSSPDWAGNDFLFNTERFSPNVVTLYAFEDTDVTITYNGSTFDSASILEGENHSFSIGPYGSFKMESTGLIIAFTYAESTGSRVTDPKPILPISKDIIGLPSKSMKLSSWSDANTYKAVHSNSSVTNASIDANGFTKINPLGTSSLYSSESLRIIASDFVIGASYADSNGYCAAPFLPVSMMRMNYAVNVASAYVAFASIEDGQIEVIDPITGEVNQTLMLSSTGTDEDSPYKVRIENVAEGTIFRSSVRVGAWYQPSTNDFAAKDDETVMFGFDN